MTDDQKREIIVKKVVDDYVSDKIQGICYSGKTIMFSPIHDQMLKRMCFKAYEKKGLMDRIFSE